MSQCESLNFVISMHILSSGQPLKITMFAKNYLFIPFTSFIMIYTLSHFLGSNKWTHPLFLSLIISQTFILFPFNLNFFRKKSYLDQYKVRGLATLKNKVTLREGSHIIQGPNNGVTMKNEN